MLRILFAIVMMVSISKVAFASNLPNSSYLLKHKAEIAACIEENGANYKDKYNVCWGLKNPSGASVWVALTDLSVPGKYRTIRLRDAQLGVAVYKLGKNEFIVYNPSFKQPNKLHSEFYIVDETRGEFVLKFDTEKPLLGEPCHYPENVDCPLSAAQDALLNTPHPINKDDLNRLYPKGYKP